MRSARDGPAYGSSWLSPGLPAPDTDSSAPPSGTGCPVRIHSWRLTSYGSEDRAKDVSAAGREMVRASSRPVHAWRCAHADSVPFLGGLGTSGVVGRAEGRGGDPLPTDGPTEVFVPTWAREGPRHPGDRDAFHRRVRGDEARRGSLHAELLRVRSLAHAAHTLTKERCFSKGIASAVSPRSPANHGLRETSAF